jgi:hypothetical protein
MPITVTMLQTRQGEGGSLWTAGSSYSASDAFGALLIASNLATGTLPAVAPSSLTQAEVAATQALVSAGGMPPGMAWLTDSIRNFDIYKHIPRPTLFFDPSATTSSNRGTYYQPYNTQTAVQAVVSGFMPDQVLGIKRGTKLRGTGANGLALRVAGSSTAPFRIVPYGDAEALPIISGGAVITTWSVIDAGNNIWQYNVGATEQDVWVNGVRAVKKAWTTNLATTALAVGEATYNSNLLYLRLESRGNPNQGQVEIAVCEFAMSILYPNIAASGFVTVAGLEIDLARNAALQAYTIYGDTAAILSVADIKVYGCKIGRAGVDKSGSNVSHDAITIKGFFDSISGTGYRATGVHVAGNYLHKCLNNSVELSSTSGAVVEFNESSECEGHSIIEFWAENDTGCARYNWGHNSSNGLRLLDVAGSGVLFANFSTAGLDVFDETHLLNANNAVYFNLIESPKFNFLWASGGTGLKFQHNTCIGNMADSKYSAPAEYWVSKYAAGKVPASTGYINISNNLFAWSDATGNPTVKIEGTIGSTAALPAGNNNVYAVLRGGVANGGSVLYAYNGASSGNFTTYKSTVGAGLDASSYSTGGYNLTEPQLAWSAASKAPGAGSIVIAAGLTTLTAIGKTYYDGVPYAAATPTIGARLGG